MKNLFTIIQRKSIALMIFAIFCFTVKTAFGGETCAFPHENIGYCQGKLENLNSINLQSSKVFSSGAVVSMSQPPMVIVPQIEINFPTRQDSNRKISLRPNFNSQSETKVEHNLDEKYFTKIVDALDLTGKKHLNQCMARISDNKLKRHYRDLSNEISALKAVALKSAIKPNKLGSLLLRTPSQKDCFKYLDFILMIG